MEFESQILQKYESELIESCRKMGKFRVKNNGREKPAESYDQMPWSILKITQIIHILSSFDLISYLIELNFIDHSNLKCLKCQGVLKLNNKQRSIDGLIYQCNGKLNNRPCNGTRSVRSNSWFSHSKLTIYEILCYSYYWWHGTSMAFIKA